MGGLFFNQTYFWGICCEFSMCLCDLFHECIKLDNKESRYVILIGSSSKVL